MTTNKQLPNISFDLNTLDVDASAGGFTKFQREKIGPDAVQYYKILPPFGENAGGALHREYSIHWGLIGARGKEKPVSCSRPTEGFCPICKKVWDAKDLLERAKQVKDEKQSKELVEFIMKFQVRRSFSYNAATIDGRVVILEIPKTAHDLLKELIKKCVQENKFDPTNPKTGAWFAFSKTGKKLETKYMVELKATSVEHEGETLMKLDRTPVLESLTSEINEQLKEKSEEGPLYDIHDLHVPRTAAELQNYLDGDVVPDKKPEVKVEAVEGDVPNSVVGSSKSKKDVNAELERLKKLQTQGA